MGRQAGSMLLGTHNASKASLVGTKKVPLNVGLPKMVKRLVTFSASQKYDRSILQNAGVKAGVQACKHGLMEADDHAGMCGPVC